MYMYNLLLSSSSSSSSSSRSTTTSSISNILKLSSIISQNHQTIRNDNILSINKRRPSTIIGCSKFSTLRDLSNRVVENRKFGSDRSVGMYEEHRIRGYKEAILALNSLQSNASVLSSIQSDPKSSSSRFVLDQNRYYLSRLGYKPKDLNKLNVIHISGTKGKGSTAAFCSSILTSLNERFEGKGDEGDQRPLKIGLYTSPHLVAVRERIRINNQPISEDLFARYFWEVWDRFYDGNGEPLRTEISVRPGYFRYLTYMAYHAFLSEGVDSTILEVGLGGLRDPTNLVPSPIVTGVSSLGLDHVSVLGKSILEIAGHKSGIFKPGVPALTIDQTYSETLQVLKARAIELKASSFTVVQPHLALKNLELGLAGDHQRFNATLAIALIRAFLASPRSPSKLNSLQIDLPERDESSSSTFEEDLPELPSEPSPRLPTISQEELDRLKLLPIELVSPEELPDYILEGLCKTNYWNGRCQKFKDPRAGDRIVWYLDGAHTVESLKCCGEWWMKSCESTENDLKKKVVSENKNESDEFRSKRRRRRRRRVLIFNCTAGRNLKDLIEALFETVLSRSSISNPSSTFEKEEEEEEEDDDYFFEKVIITSNTTYKSGKNKSDLKSVVEQTKTESESEKKLRIENLMKEESFDKFRNLNKDMKVMRGVFKELRVSESIEGAIEEVFESIKGSLENDNEKEVEDYEDYEEEKEKEKEEKEESRFDVLVTGSLHLVGGTLEVLLGK